MAVEDAAMETADDPARDGKGPSRPLGRGVREIVETVLLAVAIYVGVQAVIPPYAVDGKSMNPTLSDGERLLVNRPVYAHFDANRLWNLIPGVERAGEAVVYPFHRPERGEIVVFRPPLRSDRPYIKRVIGLPGDRVVIADGVVSINGERLPETYIGGVETVCQGRNCDVTVPEGMVFLLGDNRRNSSDSRDFGPVAMDAIEGKAWVANWPPDAIGMIPTAEYGSVPDE